jgi:hypothetical protein
VRNFGKTSAYDVSFTFPHPPTVAEYENATDGYADVVELQLPRQLPTLAPGQEWRTVWDSALDRTELGEAIESRFPGTVTYYDRVETPRGWKLWQRRSEIERMNRAIEETKDRYRLRQIDAPPTDVSLRWGNAEAELGKHRGERAV